MMHRDRKPVIWAVLLACCLGVGGCNYDPWHREGAWTPTGVNDANLAAMVANPADLYGNPGPSYTRGSAASPAVDRLLTDQVKQFKGAVTSSIAGGN